MVALSVCVHLRRQCAAVIGKIHSHVYFAPGIRLPFLRVIPLALECTFPRSSVERSGSSSLHTSGRFPTKTARMALNGHPSTKRSINFQDYDVFGFDLDHTIAKYKLVELFNVSKSLGHFQPLYGCSKGLGHKTWNFRQLFIVICSSDTGARVKICETPVNTF